MASTTPRRRLLLLSTLLPLVAFPACGGAGYTRVISVNPPEASLFINGVKVGQGSSRPYLFDFSEAEVVYVQATHPDFQPHTETFDRVKLDEMAAANLDVKISLRSR